MITKKIQYICNTGCTQKRLLSELLDLALPLPVGCSNAHSDNPFCNPAIVSSGNASNSEGNFFWDTLYSTPAVLLSLELMSPIFMDFLPPSHVCPQCALHL